MNTDYPGWSDEDLASHAAAISAEQELRATLAGIPDQIMALREMYVAGGGDPADLD